MIRTRLASSRSVGSSPKALTRVVMFFLASGRDMARMVGFRGFFRNLKISCTVQSGLERQTHQAMDLLKSPESITFM